MKHYKIIFKSLRNLGIFQGIIFREHFPQIKMQTKRKKTKIKNNRSAMILLFQMKMICLMQVGKNPLVFDKYRVS